MINELFEELKLKKIANLIEIMQKANISEKIRAFSKLEKMKITKNIGLYLIESSKLDYQVEDGNGGLNASLISLCFKEYYDDYSKAIRKVFRYLKPDAQNRVVFLLSSIDNESSLKLYVDLVLKYYDESTFIPVSNLFERPHVYGSLFPKLYKALKFKDIRNNILILVNDYLNAGVVPEIDIKKNKKLIQDAISKIFNEALLFNFKNTSEALNNEKYFDLRFFLEISVNIEKHVTCKKTRDLLDKLFTKNDNQLNLFILENYISKNNDISKLNLNSIAKDDASRYPLYDMLYSLNIANLIPKRYLNGKMLAKSDFYVNFMIHNKYKYDMQNYKCIGEEVIEGYKYYIFKFKSMYTYNNRAKDFLTEYIINQSGMDKYNRIDIEKNFIAISGGYLNTTEPSLISFNHNKLILSKVDENERDEEIIKKLILEIKEDHNKLKSVIELEEKETVEEKETKKCWFHFYYILILLFAIFIVLLIMCIVFTCNPSLIKGKNAKNYKTENYISSKIEKPDLFKEIDGGNIYNQEQNEYYVLFYKKSKKEKNIYYTYINEYFNNNVTIYYVNLNDEKNKFLFENNNLNFILEEDRFLKVKEKEFEYYVDGKTNIIKEMKNQVDEFNKAKEEKSAQ